MNAMADSSGLVVVDYGASNLSSVRRALEAAGERPLVTSSPRDVEQASALVLPGVGSANDAMKALRSLDLVESLRDFAASGKPFLGVCVGLQLLFDWSEERDTECLGILPGVVRRFNPEPGSGLKVPHMGWNAVRLTRPHPFVEAVADGSFFYFVHSYYAEPRDTAITLGATEYGVDFAALVAQKNVIATQFHPEKSAALGLRLYRNFAQALRA